jgi:hypothetical protein
LQLGHLPDRLVMPPTFSELLSFGSLLCGIPAFGGIILTSPLTTYTLAMALVLPALLD